MTDLPFAVQLRNNQVWLTVGGQTGDEAFANLAEVVGENRANELWAGFAAEANLAAAGLNPQPMAPPVAGMTTSVPVPPTLPPAPAGQAEYNPYAPPAAPAAPPAPPAYGGGGGDDWKANPPMCAHNLQRSAYEGTYKNGRNAGSQYRVYFCGAPKDAPNKCKPVDAVTGKEWN
jgi:hypothetical protein